MRYSRTHKGSARDSARHRWVGRSGRGRRVVGRERVRDAGARWRINAEGARSVVEGQRHTPGCAAPH
eukprot:6016685-Prymnesium_polylepis.1